MGTPKGRGCRGCRARPTLRRPIGATSDGLRPAVLGELAEAGTVRTHPTRDSLSTAARVCQRPANTISARPSVLSLLPDISPFDCSLSVARRLLLQGGAVDQQQFINFVCQRGVAVIAARGADGAPQAALVGITATARGELVFDTTRSSRKYRNLSAFAQVALVIGWDNEITVQCEGTADIPRAPTAIAVCRRTSPSIRTAWSAPMIPTSCTSASAQAGYGTATTGPGPSPSRRPLWNIDSEATKRHNVPQTLPLTVAAMPG